MTEYYIYKLILEDKHMEIQPLDVYDEEPLQCVSTFVDNRGKYHFYMYDNSADSTEVFLSGISDLLYQDSVSAARLHQIALGTYYRFNDFLTSEEVRSKL